MSLNQSSKSTTMRKLSPQCMDTSQEPYQPKSDAIPIDLFVSKLKKNPHHNILNSNGFNLKFTDSFANLVFSVQRHPRFQQSPQDPAPLFKRLISDCSGNPLISVTHNQKATWHGFREDSNEEKYLMFRVERTINTLTKVEFEVFLNNGNPNDPKKPNFKMRGSPFYRSCTIYNGDSIVAQTSLMYKLGIRKILVPRNRFRITIFPGYSDHAFIAALIVIFFYGRKLWI